MLLRIDQSSSSSSSSSSSNQMDLSVLDRQRDVLLRLYPNDSWHHNHRSDLHSVVDHHHHFQSQCNSNVSANPKKRKAELDVEGEVKDEGFVDGEDTGEEKSEITTKTERGISSNTCSKDKKLDYIHVRARRGQATDSHSLAERARREKISKKMKCLQDLVPGCNKVTGKAGMLDEIINYVQSLQKQVEFLSMKLATVNPRVEFSADNIFAKEMPSYLAGLPVPPDLTCLPYNTIQQGTSIDMAIDQSQKPGLIPEVFLDPSLISQLQQLSGWESDWPNLLFN